MAIDIQQFTSANISVSPTGVSGGNFGILGFLTNELGVIDPAERTRAYTNIAGVGGDWAIDSQVYKAATAFYSQTPSPRDFKVLMCFETAQAAVLTGGGHDEFATLVSITNGTLDITIDGTAIALTSLDFSGVSSADDVASVIDTALTGGTCTHNGMQYQVKSATTGVTSTISFATSGDTVDLADKLGLAQYQGRLGQGLAPETPVQALANVVALGVEFIGLVTHKKYRDVVPAATDGSSTPEIADWAEANKKIFCNTTNVLVALDSQTKTDIATILKDKTLRYSLTTFSKNSNEYPSASVFGRAASVNFEGIATTITLNLKLMPTITVEDLTPNEFAALRGKNASAVVRIGKTVNAYTDSRMAGGSWLDTTHGLLWLENRISTDMFNLLYQSTTKIPYTQAGLNLARAVLERSLEAAVRNGLAAPGYLPDLSYLDLGWSTSAVALADVPAGDKSNRIYRGLSFKMIGAGALHEVHVTGEFAE